MIFYLCFFLNKKFFKIFILIKFSTTATRWCICRAKNRSFFLRIRIRMFFFWLDQFGVDIRTERKVSYCVINNTKHLFGFSGFRFFFSSSAADTFGFILPFLAKWNEMNVFRSVQSTVDVGGGGGGGKKAIKINDCRRKKVIISSSSSSSGLFQRFFFFFLQLTDWLIDTPE